MRRWALSVLLSSLLLASGCIPEPYLPIPPAPPPPTPVPTPPAPSAVVPRSTFESIKVGDDSAELEALPSPIRKVPTDGGKTIWLWALDESRPGGGSIWWEVHEAGGKVVASFPW